MPVAAFAFIALALQGPAPAAPAKPPKLGIVDVTVGNGDPVAVGSFVTVDYTGKLADGTVFDTSKKAGREPFSFFVGLHQVIDGWDQGLIGMKPGGVRKLTIPSQLGYGVRGAPPTIPPNATLVFTISLSKSVPLASPDHPSAKLKIDTTKQGSGKGATFGDTALINFTGKTSDGKVFLSTSEAMPQGAPFQIGRFPAPPGFTFALLGMKQGEKRTVTVPADLAYGANGNPRFGIKPNEPLTLDLELLAIQDPNAPTHSKESRQ